MKSGPRNTEAKLLKRLRHHVPLYFDGTSCFSSRSYTADRFGDDKDDDGLAAETPTQASASTPTKKGKKKQPLPREVSVSGIDPPAAPETVAEAVAPTTPPPTKGGKKATKKNNTPLDPSMHPPVFKAYRVDMRHGHVEFFQGGW